MSEKFSSLVASIQPSIKDINPKLAKDVGDIKFKKKEIKIREISLEFGETIFDHGEFKLATPSDTETFSFGIVLEHGLETYMDGEDFTPLQLHTPGNIFFIDEARDMNHLLPREELNMTAGAKSMAISSKANNALRFQNINTHYQLDMDVPKTREDEWKLLCKIAHNSGSDWRARVLIISIDREVFFSARCYHLRHVLRQAQSRSRPLFQDAVRFDRGMAKFMGKIGPKINPAIMAQIKRFYFISRGHIPGLVFASDNMFGPIDLFKRVFLEVYGLQYAPNIIQPGYLEPDHVCYCPLSTADPHSSQRERMTHLGKLEEMSKTIDGFKAHVSTSKELAVFADKEIAYFHHQPDPRSAIHPNVKISEYDPVVHRDMETSKLPFCEASPFFKAGCIAIKHRQEAPVYVAA